MISRKQGTNTATPAPSEAPEKQCQQDAKLKEFLAGKGEPQARQRFVRHVVTCDHCRGVIVRGQVPETLVPIRSRWVQTVLSIAVAVVLVAVGTVGFQRRTRAETVGPRFFEGRLHGLPWGPFHDGANHPDGNLDTEKTSGSNLAVRKVGVNGSGEVESLLSLQSAQRNAAAWSDQAAIYIRVASEEARPNLLVLAIASADAAIDQQSAMPEARFNRALAIERMGLRDQAATSWRQYLVVDGGSPWAGEARARLHELTRPLPTFEQAMAKHRAALVRGEADAAQRVVEVSPLESRVFVEMEALPQWGESLARNPRVAAEHLTAARSIAHALSARGDSTMADAIAAIESASAPGRTLLARTHVALARARTTMKTAPTEVESDLRECASQFAVMGSPMAALADLYASIAAFERGRRTESAETLHLLLQNLPQAHRSVRAMALWQLGLCEAAKSRWGTTLQVLKQSAAIFDEIGERQNSAFVRQILSEVYDAIGDYDTAWEHRATLMRELGQVTSTRSETAVAAIAFAAAQRGEWRVAISMLNLEIEIARTVQHAPQEVLAFVRRSVARYRIGDRDGAVMDLREARRLAALMKDPAFSIRAEADIAMVSWIDARSPLEAVENLTRSIDFHRSRGRDMYLPVLYLERAREHRALGDGPAAKQDLDAGIAELERNRKTLADPLSRFGIFDTAGDLFREAVTAAYERGDVAGAFAYAERARARALLDVMSASADPIDPSVVPDDAALIAFVATTERLLTFVVSRGEIHAFAGRIPPAAVAMSAARMRNGLAEANLGAAEREARALFDVLISPLREVIRGKSHLVFIPSAEISALPFCALRDHDGRFLVEDYSISVAPSAASYGAMKPWRRHTSPKALIVASTSGSYERDALPSARREAFDIAGVYGTSTTLVDEQATRREILRHLPMADVVHFAGHASARTDDGSGSTALWTYGEGAIGSLSSTQIESIRLPRAPLVVLAACETGRGQIRWSEGTFSIARAFLAAGASSVVATLWQVDDGASGRFFPRFHENLRRSVSVAEALRLTQLEFIKSAETSPATWAAMQVSGR